ncbi:MAG: hypothetical protein HY842_07310 [Bacteroidetes bacterium]|nr:hypothetical protein [Bacteroidota bacterium]
MSKQAIQLTEIFKQLSLAEKLQVIELFFRNVKEEALKKESGEEKRRKAAELLLTDYLNDSELTAFTVLDGEEIYETK